MEKIIIIGNGMVGYKFCEKITAIEGYAKKFEIKVFGEEKKPAYDRVHLSEYFTVQDKNSLILADTAWYKSNKIELILDNKVTSINKNKKTVKDSNNIEHSYDKLILATGSSPFVPPIPNKNSQGVFVYRTLDDLDRIKEYAKNCKTGVVIGGGLLGLEAAKALLDLELQTHVVEFSSKLMPRQLDDQASNVLKEKIEALGIKIHTSKATNRFIIEDDRVTALEFSQGDELPADLIVISAGIRPRDELAKNSGIKLGTRGGADVNDFLETSEKDIYAIGEVASYRDFIYGLVAPGYDMADIVANNLMEGKENKRFLGADLSTKLKLIGIEVASFGDAFCETEGSKSVEYNNNFKGIYKRLNVSADGKYVVGGVLVGDASEYNLFLQMMKGGIELPENPEELLVPKSSSSAKIVIPDSATICSCNNITKGEVKKAISSEGIEDVDTLKKCTNAGTGCGGCIPELKSILNEALLDSGKEVSTKICEHFEHSRQELLQIIKAKRIKSFNTLITQHGNGDGCELCKPLVASLFASTWNDHITNHALLQDTNDRFLANIQKNGTYSVVPRIAGGEITADKLITIGEVAKKYSLYVKITGGQRVDLFGAKLNDLPNIWSELISQGFESGHAYAKGLRTVKSCVGSTWCRYGVQDSVSFAIKIENRYKGLRAPHKIKGGVTGCLRQCAETDNKDFGIIATEKGWNLYVGGNGGSKPQGAELLANDLDEETCLRYIDRYLMYYIRTAAPVTRTATWLNNLPGGIKHLREVIIDDKLKINYELELEMEAIVKSYQCEWKSVLDNEQKVKYFNHFANSAEAETLEFINERGQKIPLEQL